MKKRNLQKFVEEVSIIDWTPVFSEENSPTRAPDNPTTALDKATYFQKKKTKIHWCNCYDPCPVPIYF